MTNYLEQVVVSPTDDRVKGCLSRAHREMGVAEGTYQTVPGPIYGVLWPHMKQGFWLSGHSIMLKRVKSDETGEYVRAVLVRSEDTLTELQDKIVRAIKEFPAGWQQFDENDPTKNKYPALSE